MNSAPYQWYPQYSAYNAAFQQSANLNPPQAFSQPLTNIPAVRKTAPCCSAPAKPAASKLAAITHVGSIGLSSNWMNQLGAGGLMFAAGRLLHRLPSYPGFTDWKVFARPVLGILTVGKVNDALGLKLPPWLTGIETVGVITPLISGFSKQALKQFVVIAPVVAVLSQGAASLNKPLSQKLNDSLNIPPWITRLALSAGFIAVGVKALPKLYKPLVKSGWLKPSRAGAEAALLQACPRGCSIGTGGICMSEIMENLSAMIGAMGFKPKSERGQHHGCC